MREGLLSGLDLLKGPLGSEISLKTVLVSADHDAAFNNDES